MTHETPKTERLRLRPYTLADEAGLFDMFADPDARTFYPKMTYPAKVRAWIEWNLRNYDEFGFGRGALELRVSGRERRKGYATEAVHACLDFGFRRSACVSICSIVRPSNTAFCAVAARIHTACREFLKGDRPALLFYTTRLAWEGRPTSC